VRHGPWPLITYFTMAPKFFGDRALDLKKIAARPALQRLLFLAVAVDDPLFLSQLDGLALPGDPSVHGGEVELPADLSFQNLEVMDVGKRNPPT
jgi:hypothetical protein